MPRHLLLLSLLLIALSASASEVRWLATDHNFGAFNEDDGKVFATFRMVNTSGNALTISNVRSSCGCTVPSYSHSAILPGDTASISVAYNPTGRPGRFSKSLAVKLSNDSTYHLTIHGVVIGAANTLRSRFPVEAGPIRLKSAIIPLGPVKTGSYKTSYIEVYNTSLLPVVPAWSDIPRIMRVTAAHDTIMPGEQGVYAVSISPGASTHYGLLTDSLTFNVPGQAPLKVEVVAIIEEDFSRMTLKERQAAPKIEFDTDMIDLGTFAPDGEKLTGRLKISNKGVSPLILRRIDCADAAISVECPATKIKKGKSATASITFDPAHFSGPLLNARLQIIANDPHNPTSTVRIVGIPQSE